jgi:hypothetical protein
MRRLRHMWIILLCLVGWVSAGETEVKNARKYPEGSEKYRKGPLNGTYLLNDSTSSAIDASASPQVPASGSILPKAAAPSEEVAKPPRVLAKTAAAPIVVKPAGEAIDKYRTLSIAINLAEAFTNPYNPEDIRVDLLVTSPTGAAILQPCFYLSGTSAASIWEARFTPRVDGVHTYKVGVYKNGTVAYSEIFNLTVRPSDLDGFMHLDTGSMFHFRFDSGRPFRGVGENFGWEGGKYTFEVMLALLAENKVNYYRTWRGPGTFYIEQSAKTVGRYDEPSCARIDQIMKLSEQYGIYVMPTLEPVIEYKTNKDVWSGDIKWLKNPYNTINGGPCAKPVDFFTNATARKLYKNRLRYTVARWGSSPYLSVYEFFNEVDWDVIDEGVSTAVIAEWHQYMAAYLKSIDPYNHLVTTSLSHNDYADLWSLKDMDFTQRHLYGSTTGLQGTLEAYETKYKKPFVSGEFSLDYLGVTQHPHADYEKEVHLGVWRGMFLPTPILPMTWWWDFHADNNDYYHFKHARTFQDNMLASTKNVIAAKGDAGNTNVETRAVKTSAGVYVWIYNKSGGALSNLKIKVDGVSNVTYESKTFDTWKGTFGSPVMLSGANGSVETSVSSLAAYTDMAIWLSDRVAVANDPHLKPVQEAWKIVYDASLGQVRLAWPAENGAGASYALVDLSGKVAMSGRLRAMPTVNTQGAFLGANLALDSRKNGIYFLKLNVGNRSVSRKLVLAGKG